MSKAIDEHVPELTALENPTFSKDMGLAPGPICHQKVLAGGAGRAGRSGWERSGGSICDGYCKRA